MPRPTYEEAHAASQAAHEATLHAAEAGGEANITPVWSSEYAHRQSEQFPRLPEHYGRYVGGHHRGVMSEHRSRVNGYPYIELTNQDRENHRIAAEKHEKASLTYANHTGRIATPYAADAHLADVGITYSTNRRIEHTHPLFKEIYTPRELGAENKNEEALNKHIEFANKRINELENYTGDNVVLKKEYRDSIQGHRKAIAAYSLMKHFPHAAHTDLIEDPPSWGPLADEVEERGDYAAAHHIRALHNEHYGIKSYGVLSDIVIKSRDYGKLELKGDAEHKAFQEHIKNNPEDMVARGAYADYLEDSTNIDPVSTHLLRTSEVPISIKNTDDGLKIEHTNRRYRVSSVSAGASGGAGRFRRPVHIRVYDTHAPGTEWHWVRGNGGMVREWSNVDSRYSGPRSEHGQALQAANSLAEKLNRRHESKGMEMESKSIDYGVLVG